MAALPYPAYVYGRNPWLRGALLPDGVVNALSGLRFQAQPVATGRFIAGWRRKRLIRPTFSGAPRGYGPLYCRMAA